ncbi:MAG: TolC family outer membrane protein [Kiloniellales bacterium]|nr:TolC family outer membrane protein [Kiloniellales bacterium]
MRWAVTVSIFGLVAGTGALFHANNVAAETVKEAVEAAIAFHPQVRRDQAQSIAADQAVEEAYSDFLPDLDVDVSSGPEVTSSPTTRGAGNGGTTLKYRSDGRATFSQLLFDFFETSNEVASARSELRASHATVQATSERIARLAVEQYLSVYQAREQVGLAAANVADHEEVVDLIRGRVSAGRSAEADLDQAVSRLALARSTLVALQGSERQATSRYIETVGQAPGTLDMPEEPDVPEVGDLDTALATAMDRNPLAHSTAASWDARKSDIEVARAAYFPRFNVEATGGLVDNADGVSGLRKDLSVLLRMRWNLFSGFGDLARTRAATFEANAASRTDAEIRRQIRESVRIAFELLKTRQARLTPLRDDVTASRQTYDAYQEQFRLGQRTLLDLLDARDERFDAENELVGGEVDVLRSHFDLLFATGLLLEHFGIVIYEPEQRFDERGEGINRVAVGSGGAEDLAAASESEPQPLPVKEALAFSEIDWSAETILPGAADFGFWLGAEQQRIKSPLDEDERRAQVAAEPAVVAAVMPRRNFAEIDVETVAVMAALPETVIEELPALAFGFPEPLESVGGAGAATESSAAFPVSAQGAFYYRYDTAVEELASLPFVAALGAGAR